MNEGCKKGKLMKYKREHKATTIKGVVGDMKNKREPTKCVRGQRINIWAPGYTAGLYYNGP